MRIRLYLVSGALCFAAFAAIGLLAGHAAGSFDAAELGQYGVATQLAVSLTNAGRFPAYVVLCVLSLIFGLVRREWLTRVLVAIGGLIVVWKTSDLVKVEFARQRPLHPIAPETSFAYPSGHADLALFFYGLWAYYIWKSSLPRPLRIAAVAFAAVWIGAIGWSRLALGAHYPSDVLGGYFFGAGWLALAIAFVTRERDREPSSV